MMDRADVDREVVGIRWRWWKIVIFFVLLFAVAAAFNDFNIGISKKIGRLSTISNYDDVVYLNKAATFYFEAKRGNPAAATKAFLTTDTHSPITVLCAMLGFFAFGFSYIKVYHALTLVVFVFLAFVVAVGRKLSLLYLGSLLIASLSLPFATMCALEFRPDPLWAVVLGGSCVLFLGLRNAFANWSASVWFGVGFGLALLSKPSTFAMTIIVFGGTWFLAAVIALGGRLADVRRVAFGLLLTTAATLIIAGWYCLPHAREIFDYFYRNSFGDNKDVWLFPGTFWDRMMYYISGQSLQSNLGWLIIPLAGFYIYGAVRDIVRPLELADRLRGASFLWMLGCLYLVNGAFTMKSPFLGGSFYGFLIFGGFWYLAQSIVRFTRHEQEMIAAARWRLRGLTAVSMISVAWVGHEYPKISTVNKEVGTNQKTINRALIADLLRAAKSEPVSLMLTQGNPIVQEFLQMEFRRQNLPVVIQNGAMERSMNVILATADRMRFVVLQDQKLVGSPIYGFPAEKFQPELLAYFRQASGWKQVATYPTLAGKNVYLFEHEPAPAAVQN
jgi:hypothetical protein